MDLERLRARRADLLQQQQRLLTLANRELALLEGRIAELDRLLAEAEPEPNESDDVHG